MKIIVDKDIPYIRESLAEISDDVIYLKGSEICPADVKDADALIVRTRTKCNAELLSESKVQFVATATIGYDHIDTEYMASAGITWTNCPGCNASSVRQYVHSTLLLLEQQGLLSPKGHCLGVVGHGHVGTLVATMAKEMGYDILVCDPPLQQNGTNLPYPMVSLNEIAERCDVITFHVPMIKTGEGKTWHMADEAFFDKLTHTPYIINSSRGGVVDETALLKAMDEGKVRGAVIDTWEDEPRINLTLLNRAYIATPHIAGYSADGKVNADNMVIEALCDHFGIKKPALIEAPNLPKGSKHDPLSLYNPLTDTANLKRNPELFEHLRGNYALRREK